MSELIGELGTLSQALVASAFQLGPLDPVVKPVLLVHKAGVLHVCSRGVRRRLAAHPGHPGLSVCDLGRVHAGGQHYPQVSSASTLA